MQSFYTVPDALFGQPLEPDALRRVIIELGTALQQSQQHIAELAQRLDALESRRLTVRDLPLAALQRKLEVDWLPDASLLLCPGSTVKAVTRDEALARAHAKPS